MSKRARMYLKLLEHLGKAMTIAELADLRAELIQDMTIAEINDFKQAYRWYVEDVLLNAEAENEED